MKSVDKEILPSGELEQLGASAVSSLATKLIAVGIVMVVATGALHPASFTETV
jgi:hypothetical protein